MNKTSQVILFLLIAVLSLWAFSTVRQASIVNSTINSTTIGATTPSTVAATTLTSSTSAQFNGSVLNNGTGFKHLRVTSCTTAASAAAFCSTTVTWPAPAFADTNYTYGCSGDSNGAANFQTTDSGNKTASTFKAIVQNTPGNSAATSITLNCWAWHD
jgi:hypothetical protein